MKTRALLLSAAVCAVATCVVATPARAGGSKPTGDNTYEGRQSGSVSANDDSSGSAVVNSEPTTTSDATVSDSSVDNRIAQAIGAPTFRTVFRVRRSESAAEIQTTPDEPGVIRHTRFQQWRRGLSLATTPDVVASGPVVHLHRVRRATTSEVRRMRAPEVPATDPAPAAAESSTRVGRQVGGLTGPPGPVGPVSPATSGPLDIAPVVPPVTSAPAAPVATPPPAPARPKLPLNGVESGRMAKTALVLMLVGFGLMAFARRFKPRMRVVEPV